MQGLIKENREIPGFYPVILFAFFLLSGECPLLKYIRFLALLCVLGFAFSDFTFIPISFFN